jgi:hypothetical protein
MPTMSLNLFAGWLGMSLGAVAGAVTGLFFHREDWLGGYASWPRRMIRLGHISFFGIGLINVSFALTARTLGTDAGLAAPALLFLVGAVTMPLVCYLSAFRRGFRHGFFIPAGSLFLGLLLFALLLVAP